jgi:hypothetical protein
VALLVGLLAERLAGWLAASTACSELILIPVGLPPLPALTSGSPAPISPIGWTRESSKERSRHTCPRDRPGDS